MTDRLKAAVLRVCAHALSRAGYSIGYPARVVAQSADRLTVDVVPDPDDGRLPGMQRVPIRHGIPGLEVDVSSGARVIVSFEGGDPSRPYVASWASGANVLRVSLTAEKIELGGEGLVAELAGVVLGECPDPFTGATHATLGGASSVVLAKK